MHQTTCAIMDAGTAACAGLQSGDMVTLHSKSST